jgi:hypothetical protein
MILKYSRLTYTDTAALALASFTPALLTRLSVVRIGEELKLGAPLKTVVLPLPRCSQLTKISRLIKTCFAHPHFLC